MSGAIKTILSLLVIGASCFVTSSKAYAQWNVLLDTYDADSAQYTFNCIDQAHGLTVVAGHRLLPQKLGSRYQYVIMSSMNDGESWISGNIDLPNSRLYYFAKIKAVAVLSPSVVIAVGDSGLILRTSDGCLTWSRVDEKRSINYYDVSASGKLVVAVGGNGAVAVSEDQGLTWGFDPGAKRTLYRSVVCTDEDHVFIADEFYCTVWRSSNRGVTWDSSIVALDYFSGDTGKSLVDLCFISPRTLVAVGGEKTREDFIPIVAKSTDLGVTWSSVPILAEFNQEELLKVSGIGGELRAAGRGRLAYRSSDEGNSWVYDSIAVERPMEKVLGIGLGPSLKPIYVIASGFAGCVVQQASIAAVREGSWADFGTELNNPLVDDLFRKPVRVFDPLGRECNSTALTPGIYIVVSTSENGKVESRKVAIR